MHAFDVLGDPARRRALELLANGGELPAGDISRVLQHELGLSQPGVSQHLKVLRESGFVRVRADGTRRLYSVETAPLQDLDRWLDQFRRAWDQHLDALATELARGQRARRVQHNHPTLPEDDPAADIEEER